MKTTTSVTKRSLKNYSKHIETGYDFSFLPFDGASHDYFLLNFSPTDSIHYIRAQILKKGIVKVELRIALLETGEAVSTPDLPFGGFWFEEKVGYYILLKFISELKSVLITYGATRLIIHQTPLCYEPCTELCNYLLHQEGYHLEKVTAHYFFEGKKKIKKIVGKEFAKVITKAKENKLQIRIGNIQSFGFLQDIKVWNAAKGIHSPYQEDFLIWQVSTYPERFFLISVARDEQLIGHLLAIKITSGTLYMLASAISPKTKIKIIGETLMAHFFKLAAEQKAELIDFGPSEMDGKAVSSIMFFKSKYANLLQNQLSWSLSLEQ